MQATFSRSHSSQKSLFLSLICNITITKVRLMQEMLSHKTFSSDFCNYKSVKTLLVLKVFLTLIVKSVKTAKERRGFLILGEEENENCLCFTGSLFQN